MFSKLFRRKKKTNSERIFEHIIYQLPTGQMPIIYFQVAIEFLRSFLRLVDKEIDIKMYDMAEYAEDFGLIFHIEILTSLRFKGLGYSEFNDLDIENINKKAFEMIELNKDEISDREKAYELFRKYLKNLDLVVTREL
uniref:hypothetical protein n=1 Tax=uncultured Allobacillus sp. TaxID=1638025 RepID=UPI0025977CD9|nr:hypothetical protein [uncultured Allobacillus sp.]